MESNIKFSKNDLFNYYLTMLLIKDFYKNLSIQDETSLPILDEFKNYANKQDTNDKLNVAIWDFAKLSVEYLQVQSAITIMYHLFEQFIKVFFCIDTNKDYFVEANEITQEYNYNLKDNTYFKTVDKYRLLNNCIKHGGIKNLEKQYPELINTNCDANKYGTILDNSLNIVKDNIDECCKSLCQFVSEMYTYFEDMGYIVT